MMVLHHRTMQERDRFVLSKGHAAGALYVTLWSMGKISEDKLQSFCKDDTELPGHPSGTAIPNLLFSTGSLGHGPSLASGLAVAARHQNSGRRIYCLCSDGEWQEGSNWEALIFAVHQKLGNLTLLVDQNGWQGFGSTEEVISCSDLGSRFEAFGAHVIRVNGHDPKALEAALSQPETTAPTVILMDTVKGHRLHFSNTLESHYVPLTPEQYAHACDTLTDGGDV